MQPCRYCLQPCPVNTCVRGTIHSAKNSISIRVHGSESSLNGQTTYRLVPIPFDRPTLRCRYCIESNFQPRKRNDTRKIDLNRHVQESDVTDTIHLYNGTNHQKFACNVAHRTTREWLWTTVMCIQHSRYANRLELTAHREGYNYPGATAAPWDKGNDTVPG